MSGFFTVVHKPKNHSVRQSSLFKLMQFDESQWRGLLTDTRPEQIKKPDSFVPAYLISLDFATAQNPYANDGYAMVDRHIRIDKEYGSQDSFLANKSLCTHWHYTERFKRGDDVITIHAYFHYNILLGIYKRVNKDENLPVVDSKDSKLLGIVRNNCEAAKEIVHKLVNFLKQERAATESSYNNLIDSISDIGVLSSMTVKKLQKHLNDCRQYSAKLNDLIEDYVDVRIKHIEHNICLAITSKQAPKLQPSEPMVTQTLETGDMLPIANLTVPNNVTMSSKTNVMPFKKRSLQNEVRILVTAYKNASIEEQIKLDSEKQKIHLDITVRYFETNSVSSNNEALLKVEKQLLELPKLVDVFMNSCMSINVAAAIALYQAIDNNQIPDDFYFKFLHNILELKINTQQEHDLVLLLDYFYENSDKYRLLLSYMVDVIYKQTIDNYAVGSSYMFCLYAASIQRGNRPDVFKCLIRQIGDAQLLGISFQHYMIPLITAVASIDIYEEILEFLMEHGGRDVSSSWKKGYKIINSYDGIKSKKIKDQLNNFIPESFLNSSSYSLNSAKKADLAEERRKIEDLLHFAPINTTLFAYAIHDSSTNLQVYKKLMDCSTDLSLLLTLPYMVARCRMMLVPAWKGTEKYNIFKEDHLRKKAVDKYLNLLQSVARCNGTDYLSFYCMPRDPDSYTCVSVVILDITKKIASWSTERIMQVYEDCMREAIKANISKNNQLSIISYYAALHAINFVTPANADIHLKVYKIIKQLRTAHANDTNSIFFVEKEGYIVGHTATLENLAAVSKFKAELNREVRKVEETASVTVSAVKKRHGPN